MNATGFTVAPALFEQLDGILERRRHIGGQPVAEVRFSHPDRHVRQAPPEFGPQVGHRSRQAVRISGVVARDDVEQPDRVIDSPP